MDFNKLAIKLSHGSHASPQEGMCIMECVAYIAGERHSDNPKCADENFSGLAIALNDHAETICRGISRQQLLPLVLRLAGSKTDDEGLRTHRYRMCAMAARHITKANVALNYARSHPTHVPVPASIPKWVSADYYLPSSPPAVPNVETTTNILQAETELLRCWNEGFDVLNAMLPAVEDAYCGFEPEVVEKKLRELEEVTK